MFRWRIILARFGFWSARHSLCFFVGRHRVKKHAHRFAKLQPINDFAVGKENEREFSRWDCPICTVRN